MSVWILIEDYGYDGESIEGVYSTKELAELRKASLEREERYCLYNIEEWKVT
jgi:hypothetical protein